MPGEALAMRVALRDRHDRVRHHAADDGVPAPSKGALRRRIELGDAPFAVDRHDRVDCRLEDRTFPRLAFLDECRGPMPFDRVPDRAGKPVGIERTFWQIVHDARFDRLNSTEVAFVSDQRNDGRPAAPSDRVSNALGAASFSARAVNQIHVVLIPAQRVRQGVRSGCRIHFDTGVRTVRLEGFQTRLRVRAGVNQKYAGGVFNHGCQIGELCRIASQTPV
jgi:hypothetical protein